MNDTIIFLVLAGIALIFKLLSKAGSSGDAKPRPPAPNEPRGQLRPPAESEQERVRRFLEALGVPPGTEPPPPVRPPQTRPRRVVTPTTPRSARERGATPKWEQPLPPLTSAPPLQPVVIAEAPPPVMVAPPPVPVVPLPPARPLARSIAEQAPRPVARSLGEMLRTRSSVRQAIILREVLGPPRGQQALDSFASF